MPIYGFRCEADASHTEEHYYPLRESSTPERECETCKGHMVRDLTVEARNHIPSSGYPYVTSNISGEPIEVKSSAHEAELCKIHGVTKRDDQAWIEKMHVGHDWKTGKPIYYEPSGRGLPGSWI